MSAKARQEGSWLALNVRAPDEKKVSISFTFLIATPRIKLSAEVTRLPFTSPQLTQRCSFELHVGFP